MGSNVNFKNFTSEDGGNKFGNNMGLTRQTSIYSLTFDELQNTMGSIGKDFGSMNMDELLKNIWSAEETQNYGASAAVAAAAASTNITTQEVNNLQRQGSLTLPRTLSQKTVDEVWKGISKEYGVVKDSTSVGSSMGQRQQTLGEITLEEFLVRAGVVREDNSNINGGFFGGNVNNNTTGLGFGYQQISRGGGGGGNLMGNRVLESNNNQSSNQSSTLPLNVNGVRSNLQQQQQQQQIYPKQPAMAYANQLPLQGSPGIRGGIVGIADQGISNGLVQSAALQGGGMGMVGYGAVGVGVGVATGSPASQISPNGIAKSNGDTSSVSPVPYVFNNGGIRGRKMGGAVEKVVERRQRRMIKNRESAARSRARKQAYTTELEQEVAKLKEENQELQKKQAEIMEMQKNQVLEMMNAQQGSKRRCLRRTQTGPW